MPKLSQDKLKDTLNNPILFNFLVFLNEKPDTALGLEKREIGTKRANNFFLLARLEKESYIQYVENQPKKLYEVNYSYIISKLVDYLIKEGGEPAYKIIINSFLEGIENNPYLIELIKSTFTHYKNEFAIEHSAGFLNISKEDFSLNDMFIMIKQVFLDYNFNELIFSDIRLKEKINNREEFLSNLVNIDDNFGQFFNLITFTQSLAKDYDEELKEEIDKTIFNLVSKNNNLT